MAPGHLVVEGITAGYRGAPVLDRISFELRPGEAVAVCGRNGAGKTTLLRAISGMIRSGAGRVLLDGKDLTGMRPYGVARLGVGHVPEGRRVIPGMTVLDNLKLGGYPVSGRVLDTQLAHLQELFPKLRGWSHRRAGTLSGGEQQLLAIARAMMSKPSVLMLDEPLTGLAPVIQNQVMQALQRIEQERVSVLLVEQNVNQALRLVSRGILLEQGRILLEDTAAALRDDPRVRKGYLGLAEAA